jgi:serine beta-lactamase-like protein LACTB
MRFLSPILLCLLLCAPLRAQSSIAPEPAYAEAIAQLESLIAEQLAEKRLPAISIALVDDQKIVWAKGFGFADAKRKIPATAQTSYRVASISKLFTALGIMQEAEKGTLDIDAAVTKILPEFTPKNPFTLRPKPLTLRQMMAHRSGLVREPPVGNYFDPEETSLHKTVDSLVATTLIYPPESRIKYSNAAVAVAGRALEVVRKQDFAKVIDESILQPVDMKSASFVPTKLTQERLAKGIMWTYHGREFAAPTFEMGMMPAANLYASVIDLSKFISMLLAGGKVGEKQIIRKETLEAMYKPQFAIDGAKEGIGLGFFVNQWQGRRRLGHGGAQYGVASTLTFLPEDKLGVVVGISCDVANSVADRIASEALAQMLAVKTKKKLPTIRKATPLSPTEAAKFAGRYRGKKSAYFDLEARGGKLYHLGGNGGVRSALAREGKNLVLDDRHAWGVQLDPIEKGFRVGKEEFLREETDVKPEAAPKNWRGLIGEYGWDHNVLYILEKDGKLHALIEWMFLYPLEEESKDVFRFPNSGLYHGEKILFKRDEKDKAQEVVAASIRFKRRKLDGEDGETFRIKPEKNLEELRKIAMKAKPPKEEGVLFRDNELVELTSLDKTIKLDVRYASTNNFLSVPFYRSEKAFLQRPAAQAVAEVHKKLSKLGYGLMIHDGYRPWSVTKMFWDATPERLRIFVANPENGSRHNRGCAVDLTMYDLKSGKAVEMVGGYDEMSDRSYPDYLGGTSLQRWHRDLLRREMEAVGFTVYEAEWWHFDYKDWRKYPLGNATFEELGK